MFAFTRPDDVAAQALARELGAEWAGDSESPPPDRLDAAIIFAQAGHLVPRALAELDKGGTIVCAGIHMTDIPYELLWGERSIRSVANLTRCDGKEFLALAPRSLPRPRYSPLIGVAPPRVTSTATPSRRRTTSRTRSQSISLAIPA